MATTFDMPKPYTNYFEFNKLNPLEGVQLPTAPSITSAPSITPDLGYRPFLRYRQAPDTGLFDYNDPYEINSIADAVLTTFNPDMKRGDYGSIFGRPISDIPLLNIIPETVRLNYRTLVNPYVQAFRNNQDKGFFTKLGYGSSTFAKNVLIGGVETLDIVANPTKAFLMNENVSDAFGWGSAGRKNFDWNTGNLAKDIGLEILTDPLNWVTLFTKGIATIATKGAAREVIQETAQRAGLEISAGNQKRLARRAMNAYLSGDAKTMVDSLTRLTKEMSKRNGLVFRRQLLPEDFAKAMAQTENLIKEKMSLEVLGGLQKLIKPVERTERALFASGFFGGVYPLAKGVGKILDWRKHYLQGQDGHLFQEFTTFDGGVDILRYEEMNELVNDRQVVDTILSGDNRLSDSVLALKVRQTATQDLDEIQSLLNQRGTTWNNSEELLTLIDAYFANKYGVKSYADFMQQLRALNGRVNQELTDIVNAYRKINTKTNAQYLAQVDAAIKVKNLEGIANTMEASVKRFKDLFTPKIDLERAETKIGDTFEELLAEELNKVLPKVFDETVSIEKIRTVYLLALDNLFEKIFPLDLRALREGAMPELARKVVSRYVEHINVLKNNIFEVIKKYDLPELIPKVRSGTREITYELNLGLGPAVYQEPLDRLQMLIANVNTAFKKHAMGIVNPEFNQETYESIMDVLESTKGPSAFMDKLLNEKTKLLKDDMQKTPVNPAVLKQAQQRIEKIFEGYGDTPSEVFKNFVDTNGDPIFKIRPDEFDDAVNAFRSLDYDAWMEARRPANYDGLSPKQKAEIDIPNEAMFQQTYANIHKNLQVILGVRMQITRSTTMFAIQQGNYSKVRDLFTDETGTKLLGREFNLQDIKEFPEDFQVAYKDLLDGPLKRLKEQEIDISNQILAIEQKRLKKIKNPKKVIAQPASTVADSKVEGFTVIKYDFEVPESFAELDAQLLELQAKYDIVEEQLKRLENIKPEEIAGLTKEVAEAGDKLIGSFGQPLNKVYATSFEQIDELSELINKPELLPEVIERKKLHAGTALNQVSFKAEGLLYHLNILSNEKIFNSLNDIAKEQGPLGELVKRILQLPESTNENQLILQGLAQSIKEQSLRFKHYYDFMSGVFQLDMADTTKSAVLSTLQHPKFANVSPDVLHSNFARIFDEIVESADTFLYAGTMPKRLKVETFVEEYPEIAQKIKDFDPNLPLHDPRADIIALEEVMKLEFPDMFDPTIKYLYLDIEAVSNSVYNDPILSFAFKEADNMDSLVYHSIKIEDTDLKTKLPKDEVLEVFFPNLPRAKQVEEFKEKYSTSIAEPEMQDRMFNYQFPELQYESFEIKLEAFNRQFGANNLEEATLLFNLQEQLAKYALLDATQVKVIAHNGPKYDFPAIKARLLNYNLPVSDFDKLTKVDSLSALKSKYNIKHVNYVEEKLFKQHLFNYVNELRTVNSSSLFSPISANFADTIKSFTTTLSDASVVKNLQLPPAFQLLFSQIHSSIFTELMEIGSMNKQLRQHFLDKNFFESQEGLHFLYNFLRSDAYQNISGKVLSDKEIAELFNLKRKKVKGKYVYEGTMNLNKINMGLNQEFGLSAYGYKNTLDMEALQEWSVVKATSKNPFVDQNIVERFTRLTNSLNRRYNAVANVRLLETVSGDMERVLATLQNYKRKFHAEELRILDLKKEGLRQQWVILETLYNKLLNADQQILDTIEKKAYHSSVYWQRVFNNIFDKIGDRSLLELLEDSSYVYNKSEDMLYNLDPMYDTAAKADLVQKQFEASELDFRNLSELRDVNNLIAPKSLAYSRAIKPVRDLMAETTRLTTKTSARKTLQKVSHEFMSNYAAGQIIQLASLTPKQIRDHMVVNAEFTSFYFGDLVHNNKVLQAVQQILQNKSVLKDLGVEVVEVEGRVYMSLDLVNNTRDIFYENSAVAKYTFNGEVIEAPKFKDISFDDIVKNMGSAGTYVELLKKTYNSINFMSGTKSAGTFGDVITPRQYRALLEQLPKSILKNLGDLDILVDQAYKNKIRFNFMNLGTVTSRRQFDKFYPQSLTRLYQRSMPTVIQRAKSKQQYAMMYFNNATSINVGAIGEMSDEAVYQAFSNNTEYVLGALVKHKENDYRLKKIEILGPNSIKLARRLNAQVLPYQTYATAYSAINHDQWGSLAMKAWQGLLFMFKTGWLASPGSWIRNYIDSTMKTIIDTGENPLRVIGVQIRTYLQLRQYSEVARRVVDQNIELQEEAKLQQKAALDQRLQELLQQIQNSPHAQQVQLKTAALYEKYYSDLEEIEKLSVHGAFTEDAFEAYYNTPGVAGKLDKESFKFVHRFLVDGPSAGLSGTYFDEHFYKANLERINSWGRVQHLFSKTLAPHQWIEQVNRLTHFVLLHEAGVQTTKAYKRIADTHFDYKLMSDTERRMEMIFPFYTYFTRNTDYWLRTFRDNPRISGLIDDVMGPVWDFDDTDYKELQFNQSLHYQIVSGNIPLPYDMTFKLNPSFMDMFNMLTDPVGAVKQRLASPIKSAVKIGFSAMAKDEVLQRDEGGYTSFVKGFMDIPADDEQNMRNYLLEMIPWAHTVYQRYAKQGPTYFERSQHWLNIVAPDIFGATKRWEERPKRTYPKGTKRKKYTPGSWDKRSYAAGGPRNYRPSDRWRSKYTYSQYPRHYWRSYPNFNHINTQYYSFYKKHYTPKGMSKLKMRTAPVTSQNLQYKIKDMHYQFQY